MAKGLKFRTLLVAFLVLMVSYLLFGLSSYLLPDRPVRRSIERSVAMGDIDRDYPRAIVNKEMCRMDNCTDALILNQVWCMRTEAPMQAIMLLPSRGGETRNVEALDGVVAGVDLPVQHYPRYWHGNTFLARWLMLCLGRYANVRLALYYTSSLLILLLLALLLRHGATRMALSLSIAFLLLKGYVLQFSIQFYPVLVLAVVGAILMIVHRKSFGRCLTVLFVVGSLTAYFDLLTTPLLTLGVPLLVLLSCNELPYRDGGVPKSVKSIVAAAAIWLVGYAATWAAKWLLATCLTPVNVFADAFSTGLYRISGEVPQLGDYSIAGVIVDNLRKCPLPVMVLVLVPLVVAMPFAFRKQRIATAVTYLLVSLMPFVWYCVLANHSYVHCWFTYRALMIAYAGLLMACMCLVDWRALREKLHR